MGKTITCLTICYKTTKLHYVKENNMYMTICETFTYITLAGCKCTLYAKEVIIGASLSEPSLVPWHGKGGEEKGAPGVHCYAHAC